MLTIKQSNFLNYILEGKTQLEAYKLSYNTKAKDWTIKSKASKLFNSKDIQSEYKKALNTLQSRALYTKEKAIEDLVFLVDKSKADIDEKGIKQSNVLGLTKAIEQLSNIMCLSDIDKRKFDLEDEKIKFAKSKVKKDLGDLQKENIRLLASFVAPVGEKNE